MKTDSWWGKEKNPFAIHTKSLLQITNRYDTIVSDYNEWTYTWQLLA